MSYFHNRPEAEVRAGVGHLVGLTDRDIDRLAATPCADCGAPHDPHAMWFVPRGTHPVHGASRAICQACRDARLAGGAR